MYFQGWFSDDYLDVWFDPASVTPTPPSGFGGISNVKVLGVLSPRPAAPLWRQIEGATGTTFTETRRFLHDMLGRNQLWGNHIQVKFTTANTPTRIDSGLGGPTTGYHIVRADADVRVFDADPGTPPDPKSDRGIIWLQASAPATVTLYIY